MTLDELRDRGERVRLYFNEELQLSLDYDQSTVEWLDGYIERNRHVFTDEMKYTWAVAFGYILGEAIVRCYGGRWVRDEQFTDEWAVELPGGVGKANPIGKAYKHVTETFDSVASFFRVIGLAIEKGGFDKIGQRAGPG